MKALLFVIFATIPLYSCAHRITPLENKYAAVAWKLGVQDGGMACKLDHPKTGQELEQCALKRRKEWTPGLPFLQEIP